uniref:HABP4_PAI-RBP1 domain-containing protein n=1 Tax=Mesocestoides corti TaxID=53468 RepID=A0A5K3EY02_MESCO
MSFYRNELRANNFVSENFADLKVVEFLVFPSTMGDTEGHQVARHRRGGCGFAVPTSGLERDRQIHLSRRTDNLIIRVHNDLCRNADVLPPQSVNHRGHNIRTTAPMKPILKAPCNGYNNDGPVNRHRVGFEMSRGQGPRSHRGGENSHNGGLLLPREWNLDAVGTSEDFGHGGPREESASARSSGGRGRRGGGRRGSGGRMRRRGEMSGSQIVPTRDLEKEHAPTGENQPYEKKRERLRGAPHRRGGRRGSNPVQGGTRRPPRGTQMAMSHCEVVGADESECHEHKEPVRDGPSTDTESVDDDKRLQVDLKKDEEEQQPSDRHLTEGETVSKGTHEEECVDRPNRQLTPDTSGEEYGEDEEDDEFHDDGDASSGNAVLEAKTASGAENRDTQPLDTCSEPNSTNIVHNSTKVAESDPIMQTSGEESAVAAVVADSASPKPIEIISKNGDKTAVPDDSPLEQTTEKAKPYQS